MSLVSKNDDSCQLLLKVFVNVSMDLFSFQRFSSKHCFSHRYSHFFLNRERFNTITFDLIPELQQELKKSSVFAIYFFILLSLSMMLLLTWIE